MVHKLTLLVDPLLDWLRQSKVQIIQALVVVAVLGASLVSGMNQTPLLVLLVVGILALLVLNRWHSLGFVILIAASMLVRFGFSTGTQTEINITILLLVLLLGQWVLDMLSRQEIKLMAHGTVRALLVFTVVVVLSFMAGQLPWYPTSGAPLTAQIGGLVLYVLCGGTYLLIGHRLQNVNWLKVMTWTFIAIGGFFMLVYLVPPLSSAMQPLLPPTARGGMFWVWLVALAFGQLIGNRSLRLPVKGALVLVIAMTLYVALVLTREWTSGWAPSLVAILVILWMGSPRLALLATLLAGAYAATRFAALLGYVDVGDTGYSIMTRVQAWNILMEIIMVNPLLGLGPANYYFYTSYYRILGYNVSFNSHNNYVDLLAQTGVVGLACIVWFFAEAGRLGWRLRAQPLGPFEHGYVIGALGGLAGTMVSCALGDWLLPFVYNVGFAGFRASVLAWIFLGGLLALSRLTHTPQPEAVKA
jgi:hypothetical protein